MATSPEPFTTKNASFQKIPPVATETNIPTKTQQGAPAKKEQVSPGPQSDKKAETETAQAQAEKKEEQEITIDAGIEMLCDQIRPFTQEFCDEPKYVALLVEIQKYKSKSEFPKTLETNLTTALGEIAIRQVEGRKQASKLQEMLKDNRRAWNQQQREYLASERISKAIREGRLLLDKALQIVKVGFEVEELSKLDLLTSKLFKEGYTPAEIGTYNFNLKWNEVSDTGEFQRLQRAQREEADKLLLNIIKAGIYTLKDVHGFNLTQLKLLQIRSQNGQRIGIEVVKQCKLDETISKLEFERANEAIKQLEQAFKQNFIPYQVLLKLIPNLRSFTELQYKYLCSIPVKKAIEAGQLNYEKALEETAPEKLGQIQNKENYIKLLGLGVHPKKIAELTIIDQQQFQFILAFLSVYKFEVDDIKDLGKARMSFLYNNIPDNMTQPLKIRMIAILKQSVFSIEHQNTFKYLWEIIKGKDSSNEKFVHLMEIIFLLNGTQIMILRRQDPDRLNFEYLERFAKQCGVQFVPEPTLEISKDSKAKTELTMTQPTPLLHSQTARNLYGDGPMSQPNKMRPVKQSLENTFEELSKKYGLEYTEIAEACFEVAERMTQERSNFLFVP